MEKRKKVLVTAGSTMVMIDQVRGVTNIFTGRTGTMIAAKLFHADWDVTLITSRPDLAKEYENNYYEGLRYQGGWGCGDRPWLTVKSFKTFDDLEAVLHREVATGDYDLIVHSAAVSDYKVARVLVSETNGGLVPIDASAKVSSSHPKLYLEMTPTIKLIDQFKKWGFRGMLVKFKLQVGITDEELLEIAKKSLADSDADLIIANCLEWAKEYAYAVNRAGVVEKVSREEIAKVINDNFQEKR